MQERSHQTGIAILVGGLICGVAATSSAMPSPVDAVFEGISERLALMKDVAAWKHAKGVAVEDRAREAVVLDKATARAAALGIDAATARPFFRAQIEAAKDIQRCWIARWKAAVVAPPESAPDLQTEIRPRLLALDRALLGSIKVVLDMGFAFDERHAADFAEAADTECLSVAKRDAVYERLSRLRLIE
ncbi:MAG: gamma subclass chorismate mutase AroQ [Hyphomicrobiales bacterium]|nr:gamma subclass chorismate mutase AroQ [Hyphomicrobiales bacterium]